MTATVKWQCYDQVVAGWQDLPDEACIAIENGFKDPTIVDVVYFSATRCRYEFNLREMTLKRSSGKGPVRRCKLSEVNCTYWDGEAHCPFNSYLSAFLIDAKANGRTRLRFYAEERPYDAWLEEAATQINVTTGFKRAIHIPSVPFTEGGDDGAIDEDVDHEKLDKTIGDMPDTLSKPLMCPITQRVMLYPVVASDGHTYDKPAIERWLMTNEKSPLTGKKLKDKSLRCNHNIRSLVSAFIDKKKIEKKKKMKRVMFSG